MALGGQSKGLIQASRTAGWDPTVIPARGGKPTENIANFDKAPDLYDHKTVGDLPGGTPLAWPDGDPLSPKDTWNTRYQAEPKTRRGTRNANPFPDMPGSR